MIATCIVAVVALFLLVKACMKWGFTAAIKWTSLLCLELPVFWFVRPDRQRLAREDGRRNPVPSGFGSSSALPWFLSCGTSRKEPDGARALEGLFITALCFSTIVAVLFCFLLMGVVIHATPQAMVFIAGTTAVIMAFGRTRKRGR